MQRWKLAGALSISAALLAGCGAVAMMTDWRVTDQMKKGRPNNGEHYIKTTYRVGVPEGQAWVPEASNNDGGDYLARGYADNLYQPQGNGQVNRYFWNGRHVTWHPNGDSRGNLKSEGWMDTEGLQLTEDGRSKLRISGPYPVADWRYYQNSHSGGVTEEGSYLAFKDPNDREGLTMVSRKHGVWHKYDRSALKVSTETYDKGVVTARGSEAWPSFDEMVGTYAIDLGNDLGLSIAIEKSGKVKVVATKGSWPVGTEFWLHRSPYFNGDVTLANFWTNGGLSKVRVAEGTLHMDNFPAFAYPYEQEEAVSKFTGQSI